MPPGKRNPLERESLRKLQEIQRELIKNIEPAAAQTQADIDSATTAINNSVIEIFDLLAKPGLDRTLEINKVLLAIKKTLNELRESAGMSALTLKSREEVQKQ